MTKCSKTLDSGCELLDSNRESPMNYTRDGDVTIAAILQISLTYDQNMVDFLDRPYVDSCMGTSYDYLKHFLAFIFAIEEINNSTDILPNITLGFQVYDSCTSENLAIKSALNIISESWEPVPNYICEKPQKTVAVVGHLLSSSTFTIARLTQLYGYPQVGFLGCFDDCDKLDSKEICTDLVLWKNLVSEKETPHSMCSNPCSPGYRKSLKMGRLACCFDCILCKEGEITNLSAMESCESCPDDQWSNPTRDKCITRPRHFLSYEENLGLSLAAIATIMFGITSSVLWVFVKYRNTPLVRANNRNLSYVLLVSLIICFLLSFLFIGRPEELTCLMRQTTFGIIFAVAISSILGKTITVLIAFNATKPGSKLRKCVGSRISTGLVILCSLGEFIICLTWVICSPPFVEIDSKTVSGLMIVQCNEGSIIAFYVAVSYIGVLAVFSFIIAFISRNLPNTFNEAQYITFSMLVFCSVWISFIPTYLSTKGKYMVAVEIFAILASNGALLGFIFFPKCYIIILKPELNKIGGIQVKVIRRQQRQQAKITSQLVQVQSSWASYDYLKHYLAFLFAINVMNNSTDVLPNITLGYQIYDSCTSENLAISYGAYHPYINNREKFPLLHRSLPSELSQFQAIIQLLVHFGWTWVGIIATDDDSNQLASALNHMKLQKHLDGQLTENQIQLLKLKLNYYLKHITASGGEFFLNNGELVEGNFNIRNFVADSNKTIRKPIVGSWHLKFLLAAGF
ncbi:G-protein coupled receptor family C group 6 member A-like [Engystomops pustulosus]|uniref:G-protein coupled receptor family C group 6 member A-like n=1 Tax=Engystomops pustulosus TaxID=76066 RepID=UPI003AFA0C52